MFDLTTIFNLVLQNIAFRQTSNPCYPLIKSDLLVGTQNATALRNTYQFLQNEFIYDTVAMFDKTSIERAGAWNALTAYSIGDRVKFVIGSQTFVFVSLSNANTGNTPAFQSNFWESDLSNYLRTSLRNSTEVVLNDLTTQYATDRNLPLIRETSYIFEQLAQGSYVTTEAIAKFRGVYFRLGSQRDMAIKLSEIQIKLDSLLVDTTVNFYLYHSSISVPLEVYPVTFLAADNGRYVSKPLINALNEPCILKYWQNNTLPKGAFMLGFWEDDLPIGTKYEQFQSFFKRTTNEENLVSYPVYFNGAVPSKPNSPSFNLYLDVPSNFYCGFNVVGTNSFDYTETFKRQITQITNLVRYDCVVRILQDEQNSNRKTNDRSYAENIADILHDKYVGEKLAEQGLISQFNTQLKGCKLNLGYQGGSKIFLNFG